MKYLPLMLAAVSVIGMVIGLIKEIIRSFFKEE